MKKVVFVCLGNICRSPMAEFVMKSLTDDYEIESRATSSWEHGNPIHKGTQKIFKAHEIPYDSSKTSQQISKDDFEYFDYVIGMDESNLLDLTRMCPQDQRICTSFESLPFQPPHGDELHLVGFLLCMRHLVHQRHP